MKIWTVAIVSALCSLVSNAGSDSVTNGMPRFDVLRILGQPKARTEDDTREALFFEEGRVEIVNGCATNITVKPIEDVLAERQAGRIKRRAREAMQRELEEERADKQRYRMSVINEMQQRQAALITEQKRQAALRAEQQRLATLRAEQQRQAALRAEQQRLATLRAEQQRLAALRAHQGQRWLAVLLAQQHSQAFLLAEQQRQATLRAEQQRQATLRAERRRQPAVNPYSTYGESIGKPMGASFPHGSRGGGYQHGWRVYKKPQLGYSYGPTEMNPYGPGGSKSYGPGGGKSYGQGGAKSYGPGGGKSYGPGGGQSYGPGGGKDPSNPWTVAE